MDRKSIVLYQALLEDLSDHLPLDVITALSGGSSVNAWPDITPKQLACLQLAKSFYKKFVGVIDADADERALRQFLAINDDCSNWDCDLVHSWEEEAVGCIKKHLYNFFYPKGDPLLHSLTDLFSIGRCGPGASVGAVNGSEYAKMYSSPLTATSEVLYRAYRASHHVNPDLAHAELIRFAKFGRARLVEGNRLGFVAKQKDISRITCTEPVLNMYGQLGLGSLIERRLITYFGIDLSTQPTMNRDLARMGSLADGTYCTIDLKSASDSISLKMLQEIIPKDAFAFFDLLRSKETLLPDGRRVKLNMVSTMGNGFTFPLQTAIFASVVSAAYDMHGIRTMKSRGSSPGNFGVFGDDIVVLKAVYRTTVRLLNILGFTVNADKSFSEGPFRESCGGDYYYGHDVRGIYVKDTATTQDRVVVLNLLHRWSAKVGVYILRCTRLLFQSLPKRFIPFWDNDDAGIKVPFSLIDHQRRCKSTQSIVYRKWTPTSRSMSVEFEEAFTRKSMIYNPVGLWLCFLRGHVRMYRMTLRQREVRYTTKSSVAPLWDPPRRVSVPDTDWQRWETAVWLTVS